MIHSLKTKTVALAAVGALTLGGGAYALAATSGAPSPLTGSITEKAADAAVARVPGGTLVGLRSDADGGYRAEVRKADGTSVELTLDRDFKVTATRTGGPGRHGGHGGPGGPGRGFDTAALAKTLGVTEARLQSALDAARPDGNRKDRKDDRAAAIAKALGATTADVESVLKTQQGEHRRGFGGRSGGPGPDSALVSALAKKTGKTTAEVQRALEAARPDRGGELAAAIAKALDLDTAKVKAALEAQRPERRP